MDHVGMDLGKKESQIAIITDAGELVEKRMRTERERLRQFFAGRAKARIVIEASTISEWVARLLKELGHEVVVADPTGTGRCFSARVRGLDLPEHLVAESAPLLATFEPLNEQIQAQGARLEEVARRDVRVRRMMTMPQIGPVTAVSFVATLDDMGNARLRWLLVEAAWRVLTHKKRPETQALRKWAERITRRRGKRIAGVALAQKLSGILYAMWRDGSAYEPAKLSRVGSRAAAKAA